MTLNPYMVWVGDDPSEWIILAFAHTAREAKKVGYPVLLWFDYYEWVDVRVRLIRGVDWLMDEADKELMEGDQAHVRAPIIFGDPCDAEED